MKVSIWQKPNVRGRHIYAKVPRRRLAQTCADLRFAKMYFCSLDLLLYVPFNSQRPDMTIAFDWDLKQYIKPTKNYFLQLNASLRRAIFAFV